MFTVQKTAVLKNSARHQKMIEACDNSPEDKNFLKICRELMQQPLSYLERRRTGTESTGGMVKMGRGDVRVNELLELKRKMNSMFQSRLDSH